MPVTSVNLSAATETEPVPLTPSVAVKVAVADRPSAAITRFVIAPFVAVASTSEKVVASIASEKVKVTWAVVPASSSGVVAIATVTSGLTVSIVTEAVFEASVVVPGHGSVNFPRRNRNLS